MWGSILFELSRAIAILASLGYTLGRLAAS
jgi:hypothetical protein